MEPRWDCGLELLGKEVEDFKSGEIIFSNEETIIPILSLSDGIIDIFELNGDREISEIHVKKNIIPLIIDFFKLKKCGVSLFYQEKIGAISLLPQHKHYKDITKIQILKYLYQGKEIDIKVYCPIKHHEILAWRNEWFKKLKDSRK